MYLKIKNINVVNANSLSSSNTMGFSLTAFRGFLDNVTFRIYEKYKTYINIDKFGIIVHDVELNQSNIVRDSANSIKGKEIKNPSLLQNRYFNFKVSLILNIFVNDEKKHIINNDEKKYIIDVINQLRIQGGIIQDLITIDDIVLYDDINDSNIEDISSVEKIIEDISDNCYLISDESHNINTEEDLLIQYKSKLCEEDKFIIANSYLTLKEITHYYEYKSEKEYKLKEYKRLLSYDFLKESNEKVDNYLVEHSYTICKSNTKYKIKTEKNISHFMFGKHKYEYNQNNVLYYISATNFN